ncbi:MAG: ABC transporter permease, partial [Clostridia bacterium]|nr:ABC transporter permease [Clostridia bacterium]
YKPAVMNLVVDDEPTLVNQASPYGVGGYVMFENQTAETTSLTSDVFSVTATGNYVANIVLGDTDNALGSKLGEYSISFVSNDTRLLLKDFSTDYTDCSLNISNALVQNGLDALDGSIVFELKATEQGSSYILVKSCNITANDGVKNAQQLADVSFDDATAMVLLSKDALGVFPAGYWSCTGRKGVYASEIYYCSFVYDTYAAVYDETEVVYASSDFQKLIDQGLCEYDPAVGESSFKILSDECPISSVVKQTLNSKTGKLLELKVMCPRYKQMGYKTMPKYIFGTDDSGVDVLTRMFAGLRTSLLLGVCTFAFCFLFGLVWGSISGYFGGTVDLAMERFCDILGGVPWIVIMTLCILHFGNNFLTFFLALCLTGWMGTAGGTRTQFYRFKHMEYVLASRTLGSKDLRLIFKHILPNSLGTIVTSSVLMIPGVIFSESTLAYLNLGLQGVASFGVMLADNQRYIQSHAYLIIIPSVVMALLMISFNLFGNGLRDAINPTLKGSE